MIKGILSFKPLADGSVQILIKGGAGDIPELARLYGKEVQIDLAVEKAEVQSSVQVQVANVMHKFEELMDDLRRIHDEEKPAEAVNI